MVKKRHKSVDCGDLELELKKFSQSLVHIVGDGNCLFRSLSDQIYGNQDSYSLIRQSICQHILENESLYADFITDKNHIHNMQKDGIYGGNLELVAASRMLKRNIHVYQAGIGFWKIELDGSQGEPIHIAYHHDYEHYSSVRNIEGPFTGLPKVKVAVSNDGNCNQNQVDIARSIKYEHLEKIVKKSIDLSEIEAATVKNLLVKFGGNPSSVVDYLFKQRALLSDDKQDKGTFIEITDINADEDESLKIERNSPQISKKLTPKQKREARNVKISISREKRKSKKHSGPAKTAVEPSIEKLNDVMKSISI